jgi:hypothetical protein
VVGAVAGSSARFFGGRQEKGAKLGFGLTPPVAGTCDGFLGEVRQFGMRMTRGNPMSVLLGQDL